MVEVVGVGSQLKGLEAAIAEVDAAALVGVKLKPPPPVVVAAAEVEPKPRVDASALMGDVVVVGELGTPICIATLKVMASACCCCPKMPHTCASVPLQIHCLENLCRKNTNSSCTCLWCGGLRAGENSTARNSKCHNNLQAGTASKAYPSSPDQILSVNN